MFGLEKLDWWNAIRTSAIQSVSRPMRFLGFSNHEKGAPRQEISKSSMVCSTFSRSGWSVVRSALFSTGGTSKRRPSPHLHNVPTRSNKVSPQTLQTVLALSDYDLICFRGNYLSTVCSSCSSDMRVARFWRLRNTRLRITVLSRFEAEHQCRVTLLLGHAFPVTGSH
jgi:hypothetical protein